MLQTTDGRPEAMASVSEQEKPSLGESSANTSASCSHSATVVDGTLPTNRTSLWDKRKLAAKLSRSALRGPPPTKMSTASGIVDRTSLKADRRSCRFFSGARRPVYMTTRAVLGISALRRSAATSSADFG